MVEVGGGGLALITLAIKWIPCIPTFLHIHHLNRYNHGLGLKGQDISYAHVYFPAYASLSGMFWSKE